GLSDVAPHPAFGEGAPKDSAMLWCAPAPCFRVRRARASEHPADGRLRSGRTCNTAPRKKSCTSLSVKRHLTRKVLGTNLYDSLWFGMIVTVAVCNNSSGGPAEIAQAGIDQRSSRVGG